MGEQNLKSRIDVWETPAGFPVVLTIFSYTFSSLRMSYGVFLFRLGRNRPGELLDNPLAVATGHV